MGLGNEMTPSSSDRRQRAIDGAKRASAELRLLGVEVLVTGSLAIGDFGSHSEVDFLVFQCPRHLKYAIESVVEDVIDGLPFDVVYLDEVPDERVAGFVAKAVVILSFEGVCFNLGARY
jgi:hypothetical protein